MGGGWWSRGNAKRQFLSRLHKRVGFPWPLTFEDAFVFQAQNDNWKNLDQLEAVVEFYVNFSEPWSANARPKAPGDATYQSISFRPPVGTSAKIVATGADPVSGVQVATMQLDDSADLRWLVPNPPDRSNPPEPAFVASPGYPIPRTYLYDTLWLEADTHRPNQLYRIRTIDNQHHTVTLDDIPVFRPGVMDSRWKINARPILVLIDPFGARERGGRRFNGQNAMVNSHDPQGHAILTLDAPASAAASPQPNLLRVNPRFDTIYLPKDKRTGRPFPFQTYRILAVDVSDPANLMVTVDGDPDLSAGPSPWHIPAGVSGDAVPTSTYDIAPVAAHNRGFDHYDGIMFVVYNGTITNHFRWTSFTAHDYGSWSGATWRDDLSSIRGNKPYFFRGFRSPKAFINYAFAVVDLDTNNLNGGITSLQAADRVAEARYYFGTPAPTQADPNALDQHIADDSNGKTEIRIHRGNVGPNNRNGSSGCIVSTESGYLRRELIDLYRREYSKFHGAGSDDTFLHTIRNTVRYQVTNNVGAVVGGEKHWDLPPNPWPTQAPVSAPEWDKKIAGVLWLIRPDELPLTRLPYP